MPFKHACFISYRFPEEQLMRTFIDELCEALKSYLEPYFDLDVYLDKDLLRGGDLYSPVLAQELCHSVCMILVYTPKYFDKIKTFCTWEYKLMEQIEQRRLQLLKNVATRGLIIPIVFKGNQYLPPFLKRVRHHYDFTMYKLSHSPMISNDHYEPYFEKIANYIYERYQEFEALGQDPCADCQAISLPAEQEIQDFLKEIIRPFPGR